MAKARRDDATGDLFAHERLFPVETPRELETALDFNSRVSQAMSRAIREAGERGLDRYDIARAMTSILGLDVTVHMINAYTSQSRETHTISLVRFKAFVRATGCLWLWNVVLEGDGVTLLQGEEALLAQAAWAKKRGHALLEEARALEKRAPFEIRRQGAR